jgi:hypothetical protein
MNHYPTPLEMLTAKRAGKTITVYAAGRDHRLGAYINAWRMVKSAPEGALFNESLRLERWTGGHCTREEILQQYSDGVHDRINRHIPWYCEGHKWDSEWQWETHIAARQLNTPRLHIHWLPPWLRARFKHRITSNEE